MYNETKKNCLLSLICLVQTNKSFNEHWTSLGQRIDSSELMKLFNAKLLTITILIPKLILTSNFWTSLSELNGTSCISIINNINLKYVWICWIPTRSNGSRYKFDTYMKHGPTFLFTSKKQMENVYKILLNLYWYFLDLYLD